MGHRQMKLQEKRNNYRPQVRRKTKKTLRNISQRRIPRRPERAGRLGPKQLPPLFPSILAQPVRQLPKKVSGHSPILSRNFARPRRALALPSRVIPPTRPSLPNLLVHKTMRLDPRFLLKVLHPKLKLQRPLRILQPNPKPRLLRNSQNVLYRHFYARLNRVNAPRAIAVTATVRKL